MTTIRVVVLLFGLLMNFQEIRCTLIKKAVAARVVGGRFSEFSPPPPPVSTSAGTGAAPATAVADTTLIATPGPSIVVAPAEVVSVTTVSCPDDDSLPEAIKAAILAEDITLVATLLACSDDAAVLAPGFIFTGDDRALAFIKSEAREGDPDVVTMKAIATSSISSEAFGKLAKMMRLAVGPYGGSTLENQAKLEADLVDVLSDADTMRSLIAADPAAELGKRRLQRFSRRLTCDGCSPADSTVCSNCWSGSVCGKFFWCKDM